ncbi:HD domain-containing protein [Chryseobacterium sp. 2TAF14]|uniref:HD domain-containing protein n=1 Tax=Chryseobacterium sp. 2TAF14 TaxID=3233007 RepID=UPI003F8F5A12
MDKQNVLHEVITFADRAHGEQMRKYSPDRYIVHPIRVMQTCGQYIDRLPVLAAAILHDVLEDTLTSASDIKLFLLKHMSQEEVETTIQLVTELTDVYIKKDFPHLNRFKRKKKELNRLQKISPDAQTIKYADIIDNAKEISQSDPDFSKRYLQECYDIVNALESGSPDLRHKAFEVIQSAQKRSINKDE